MNLVNKDSNESAELESSEVGILGSDENSSANRDNDELNFSDDDTQSTAIQNNESSQVKDPSSMVDCLETNYSYLSNSELQKLADERKLSTTKNTNVSLRALLSANDMELSTKSTN